MNIALRQAYELERNAAEAAMDEGRIEVAFHHLERAHILSQRHTLQHVHVHWLMLRLGASIGAWREVTGQLPRMFAAALFSRIWVPVGNTGRAHVGALKPMSVPDDLREFLEDGRA